MSEPAMVTRVPSARVPVADAVTPAAQAAVLEYLANAPGVTGQMLQADGNSAEMA